MKHMAHSNSNIVREVYFVDYTIEVNKTNEQIKQIISFQGSNIQKGNTAKLVIDPSIAAPNAHGQTHPYDESLHYIQLICRTQPDAKKKCTGQFTTFAKPSQPNGSQSQAKKNCATFDKRIKQPISDSRVTTCYGENEVQYLPFRLSLEDLTASASTVGPAAADQMPTPKVADFLTLADAIQGYRPTLCIVKPE